MPRALARCKFIPGFIELLIKHMNGCPSHVILELGRPMVARCCNRFKTTSRKVGWSVELTRGRNVESVPLGGVRESRLPESRKAIANLLD